MSCIDYNKTRDCISILFILYIYQDNMLTSSVTKSMLTCPKTTP